MAENLEKGLIRQCQIRQFTKAIIDLFFDDSSISEDKLILTETKQQIKDLLVAVDLLSNLPYEDAGYYDSTKVYNKLQTVTDTTSITDWVTTYVSVQDNNVGNPLTDSNYWRCVKSAPQEVIAKLDKLTESLNSEITERTEKDADLKAAINLEISERTAAINKEIEDRKQAIDEAVTPHYVHTETEWNTITNYETDYSDVQNGIHMIIEDSSEETYSMYDSETGTLTLGSNSVYDATTCTLTLGSFATYDSDTGNLNL